MTSFREIGLGDVPWREVEQRSGGSVFLTPAWLSFLKTSQGGRVVAAQWGNHGPFLFGLKVHRFGLPMFGSPLKGWTTPFLGFSDFPAESQEELLRGARRFAFETLGCLHFELADPRLDADRLQSAGFRYELWHTRRIDLTQPLPEIFSGFASKSCRYSIRKAEKLGVVVEVAEDPERFATEYFAQLESVFARRGLTPTYDAARVRELCEALVPPGSLALLRARSSAGRVIATGLFPGGPAGALFWGGASWREELDQCPNELLMWTAIQYWKRRGAAHFDLGGDASYKRKYGGAPFVVPRVMASRPSWLVSFRALVKRAHRWRQRLLARANG